MLGTMTHLRRVLRASGLAALVVVNTALASAQPGGGQRTPARGLRPGEDAPKGTAVLKGVVVASDTGTPIRRAQVRAVAPDSGDNRMATTDAQGRFEIRELAGGRYTLTASKGGFVTLQYGQRRPSERGTAVDLPAGSTVDKIAIGLPRGSVIAGRIVDEFGEPLTGAQVQVLRYQYVNGQRQLRPAGQSDRTDDQGSFRVFGLPPGEYAVSATLREDRASQRLGNPNDEPSTGYAPTYFPGTTTAADAQRVAVALGQEVSGISFGLSLAPLSRVRGRVMAPAGSEPGGLVMAVPAGGVAFGMGNTRGGAVRGDGTFELPGLAPGSYTLVVRPQGRRGDTGLSGSLPITVGGGDLDNVTIALLPTAIAAGRIETDTGAPATFSPAQVRVSAVPAQPSGTPLGGSGQGQVADDYSFELRGLFEPSYLRVNLPSGWNLKAVVLDGQDVTDAPLAFAPGTRIAGLRVVLTQATTAVTGTVRDDRGAVVLDSTVVVFPADESRWSFYSRFIRTARPDTTGTFAFSALPPGDDYRVLAVQGLEEGQALDPEFLASIRDRAERLSLNAGETKTLELRLRQ
jgi:Carboxypeptidase regulatory-like domain